jgi:hypothetical protein
VLLPALHKNNASDAYVIVLFDHYAAVKPEINAALDSLKFKQDTRLPTASPYRDSFRFHINLLKMH